MMQIRSNIQRIVRSILFVTLIGMFYIYTSVLFKQDNPLLLFLTASAIFTFLLILLNPKYGMYSYRNIKKPTFLILLLSSAISVLVRLLAFSYTDNVLLSYNTIGIIACSVISSNLLFIITKSIYSDNAAFLATFMYAFWPTHIYLGNSDVILTTAETMILFSILLVVKSDKTEDRMFEITTTITSAVAFISALILNISYIAMILTIFTFYMLYSFTKKPTSYHIKRFLIFISTASLILIPSILSDEFLNTRFWNTIKISTPSGGNLNEKLIFVSDSIQNIWGSKIETGNNILTYLSTVFLIFILLAYIAGILNSMKDLRTEYLLFASYPLLFTVIYTFVPFNNTTYLCTIPFILIVAANGITSAFTYIPLPLKERYTANADIPAPHVELDDSFTIPGRWGYILKQENKNAPKCTEQKNNDTSKCTELKTDVENDENERSSQPQGISNPLLPNCSELNSSECEEDNEVNDDFDISSDHNITSNCSEQKVIEESSDESSKNIEVEFESKPEDSFLNCTEKTTAEDLLENISFSGNSLFAKDGSISLHAKKAALRKAYTNRKIQLTKFNLEKEKQELIKIDTMVDLLYENKDAKSKKR